MKENIKISGFSDEISSDFTEQLETVTRLGMHYISLRSANGKGIADYTVEEVEKQLLPKLQTYQVQVSSIGSPIGKIEIEDEESFETQKSKLEELCKIANLLNCEFIRIFSFFIPKDKNPEEYKELVITKLQEFIKIAKQYDIILIHENEKEIYGDIGIRCKTLMGTLYCENFAMAFDFANFVQCKQDTKQCFDMLKPYIKYIHIKDAITNDNENVVCGTGEGKIAKLLKQAIIEEGYEGFLTLEPHLVLFDSLSSLETTDAKNIIKENKAENGAKAYEMQYKALCNILVEI